MQDNAHIKGIVAQVGAHFRCFGGGKVGQTNSPVAEALKDKPLTFATGVGVEEVVTFIALLLENYEQRERARRTHAAAHRLPTSSSWYTISIEVKKRLDTGVISLEQAEDFVFNMQLAALAGDESVTTDWNTRMAKQEIRPDPYTKN